MSLGEIPSASPVRVLIADDSPVFLSSLACALARSDGLTVVATAADGREAVEAFVDCQPELVILDLRMPNLNGLEAATQLRRLSAEVRIIVISVHGAAVALGDCLAQGADSFVSKVGLHRELRLEIARLFPGRPVGGHA